MDLYTSQRGREIIYNHKFSNDSALRKRRSERSLSRGFRKLEGIVRLSRSGGKKEPWLGEENVVPSLNGIEFSL